MSAFQHYLKMGQTSISNYLLQNFNRIGLTSQELVMYLELRSFLDRGNQFPNVSVLAKNSGISVKECYQILHELISKKLMTITTSNLGDAYDFSLLEIKIMKLLEQDKDLDVSDININSRAHTHDETKIVIPKVEERKKLFKSIQQEFGRQLSPLEIETISQWLREDHYSVDLIHLALKEAVLNQVYNLKYMDRILLNWEKHNLTSPVQIEAHRKKREEQKSNSSRFHKKDGPEIPLFKID